MENKRGEVVLLMGSEDTCIIGEEPLDMRGEVALDVRGEAVLENRGEALDIKGETALDVAFDMLLVLGPIEEMTGDAPPMLTIDEMALLSVGEKPPLTATPTVNSDSIATVVQGNSDASIGSGDLTSWPSSTGVSIAADVGTEE